MLQGSCLASKSRTTVIASFERGCWAVSFAAVGLWYKAVPCCAKNVLYLKHENETHLKARALCDSATAVQPPPNGCTQPQWNGGTSE